MEKFLTSHFEKHSSRWNPLNTCAWADKWMETLNSTTIKQNKLSEDFIYLVTWRSGQHKFMTLKGRLFVDPAKCAQLLETQFKIGPHNEEHSITVLLTWGTHGESHESGSKSRLNKIRMNLRRVFSTVGCHSTEWNSSRVKPKQEGGWSNSQVGCW